MWVCYVLWENITGGAARLATACGGASRFAQRHRPVHNRSTLSFYLIPSRAALVHSFSLSLSNFLGEQRRGGRAARSPPDRCRRARRRRGAARPPLGCRQRARRRRGVARTPPGYCRRARHGEGSAWPPSTGATRRELRPAAAKGGDATSTSRHAREEESGGGRHAECLCFPLPLTSLDFSVGVRVDLACKLICE